MKLNNIGFYSLYDERAKNVSEYSQMKRCEMIITEYCNFKCPYCRGLDDEIYGDRKLKQLVIEEIKQNIDYWCKNSPLENIRFSGGEPTLHKDIVEAVDYAKNKGIKRIAISTNGSSSLELYKELINKGVNDFSISLDACCAEDGDKMAGGKKGSWEKVVNNIREISKLTYVTVGVVLTPENIEKSIDIIYFAHDLGVADIRVISSAQWDKPIPGLSTIKQDVLDAHPILKYRVNNFIQGRNVRSIKKTDNKRCPLVLDDSVIAGDYFFPCIIYMREKGNPIGKVGNNMRKLQAEWVKFHNTHTDPICKKNCLDICVDYNNKCRELKK